MKVHASAPQISTRALAGMLMAALAVLSVPRISFAQTQPPLAEVARREAERRKTAKVTQKVITTKDLPESARRAPAPAAAPAAGTQTAPGAAGGDQAAAPNAKPSGDAAAPKTSTQDEASWRARIQQAREGVRRNEAFAEALQSRINGLTSDFASRDNPVQRAKIGEDRQKALAELDRVRKDIEQGKQQIADIEEEARKAGVPPGWLR